MFRVFWSGFLARVRAAPSLVLLTVFGVALGVASVFSIQILNRAALGAFEGSVRAVSGEADLSVMPRTPAVAEELLPRVLGAEGVEAAWPLLRADVPLEEEPGFYLELVGLDPFGPWQVPWEGEQGELSDFLLVPGWAAITPELAEERGWEVGDEIPVTHGTRRFSLTVGALVDFRSLSPLASTRLVVLDLAQAQSLLGRRGELSQIDLRARPDADLAALRQRLATALGPTAEVMTPEQRQSEAADLLAAFRLNLTALSLISLIVGMFLIHSTTQAALVRRRKEFGLLRSLGAGRAQVAGVILAEVALLGLLGVAVGLPVGWFAARANLDAVSATLTNLYLLEEIRELPVPPWMAGVAALVGVAGALIAALFAAWDTSRQDPVRLLAAYTLHERIARWSGGLFGGGVALLALVCAWFFAFASESKPGGFVLALAILLAVPLSAPLLIQKAFGRVRIRRFRFGYALRSLQSRLHGTSLAVGALAVAVSMLVGITVMVGSFRTTLDFWMERSVVADVYVGSHSGRRPGDLAPLDAALLAELVAADGVARVDRLRGFRGWSGERPVSILAVDMGLEDGEDRFLLREGDAPAVYRRLVDEGAVIVSEPLARKFEVGVGDTLPLTTPEGERRFQVAGTYYEYGNEIGTVAMDLSTLEEAFGPGEIQSVALYVEDGRDPDGVVDGLKQRYADEPLVIRSNATLRGDALEVFDQTFAVTRILQVMSLLIAAAGTTLTLLILARERLPELALYRALGARRPQLFRLFLGKGLGMGALGLLLGLAGGAGLAAVLIFVINRVWFGWTIQVHLPWRSLVWQALAILFVAAAASLYPALRASNTPASELSRDDV